MPDPHKIDNEKSVYLDREEHIHRGELGGKRVVMYTYDANTDTLVPFTSSGGGGAGDASAANQVLQIAQETETNTNLGAQADAVATTDTGTFSLISLFKRLLQWQTTAAGYLQSLATNQQTDTLTNTELRASPVDTADINRQEALPYAETLTATTAITPTAGKRIKIVKAQILQSPANETFNLVTLSFVSTGDFFKVWAGSDSNEWIGDIDEDLDITLANSQPVSVNIRYKEIT